MRTGGEQVESTKATAAAVHFAAATRDAADKIFISLEHEKAVYGRGSPGMSRCHLHAVEVPCED